MKRKDLYPIKGYKHNLMDNKLYKSSQIGICVNRQVYPMHGACIKGHELLLLSF